MSKDTHDEIMNLVKKSKVPPQKKPTAKENAAAEKRVKAAMKKAGFKTLEEYVAYIDRRRGY